ncbi:MAG: shikimate kinase [Micrococcales bacterium]
MDQVVVLIGPMGVGKTTVGKKLAHALNLPFIDTDASIVSQHGDISNIFETQGEQAFRQIEEQAVLTAISKPAVVATGGGAVLSELTRERLKACKIIYLSTDGKHMKSRLRNGKRPLLKNGFEDWQKIYEARKPIYESLADIQIDASGRSLSVTLTEIKEKLGVA